MNRRCLIVALFLGMVAVQCAHSEVFFRDNFDSGKSSRWKQRNDGPRPGSFAIQDRTYRILSNDPLTSLPRTLISSFQRSDYFIQADVKIRGANPAFSAASLLSYYTDSNSYYEFGLDAAHHYWHLQKVDKSGTAVLASGPIPGSRRFTYRMGLYVRQGNLRALIDGIMVADELDQRPLPAGAFGLSSQGAETRWDNVLVKDSNPQDFFYSIESRVTDASGKVGFNNVSLQVTDSSGSNLAGVIAFRIRRDGLSYFVFQDRSARLSLTSGFLSEFAPAAAGGYRVTMAPAGATRKHTYEPYQVDWLLDLLRRSARLAPRGVTVDLRLQRDVYLKNGTFQAVDSLLTDEVFAGPGVQAEINQIDYGKWEEFGNYTRFPSFSGTTSASDNLIRKSASIAPAPSGTPFTLYTMRLAASGAPQVALGWFLQEDPRAFLLVESATLPPSVRRGEGYSIPFTLMNTGENAGAFTLSVILSRNSFPGVTDVVLGKRSYAGLAAGGQIRSDVPIQIPSTIADGSYFLATLLQTEARRDRLLRVHNGNQVKAVTVGDQPAPGRLSATLSWSGGADLDLHLTDPMGETIYYFHPDSATGGRLQQDRECGESEQPEVITYPTDAAFSGSYILSIHYFRSCSASNVEVGWSLTVDSDKGTSTYSGKIQPGQFLRVAEVSR